MSEEKATSREESWRLRRIRRAERKESLPPSPPLFPPEENERPDEALIDLPPPDLSLLPDDDDAPSQLAQAGDVMRPLRITPQEERYPPLPNASPAEDDAPQTPQTRHSRRRPAPAPAVKQGGGGFFYNVLTALFTLATLGLCGLYALIWAEPQSILNPFPPEIVFVYVTATPQTASVPALVTPPPTTSDAPAYPFSVADDGILYIADGGGRGCDWASVGGVVTDADGRPLNGYRVRITDADDMTETFFTGATQTFGEGGFEFPLDDASLPATYTLQLFSPQDAPLSAPVTITTRADCEGNVVMVLFTQ